MQVEETKIPAVKKITHPVHEDDRGYFQEIYHREKALENELEVNFVQDNFSKSCGNVLRGLHYQLNQPQGKLVQAISGKILDVAVDIRRGSPTFGDWVGVQLAEGTGCQLYIPEGFAHGFYTYTDETRVLYKCTGHYDAEDDRGIRWNDPQLDIDWPAEAPILSKKDRELPPLGKAKLFEK